MVAQNAKELPTKTCNVENPISKHGKHSKHISSHRLYSLSSQDTQLSAICCRHQTTAKGKVEPLQLPPPSFQVSRHVAKPSAQWEAIITQAYKHTFRARTTPGCAWKLPTTHQSSAVNAPSRASTITAILQHLSLFAQPLQHCSLGPSETIPSLMMLFAFFVVGIAQNKLLRALQCSGPFCFFTTSRSFWQTSIRSLPWTLLYKSRHTLPY